MRKRSFIYVLTRRIATYHAHDNEKPANKNSSEIRSGSSYLRNKQTFLKNSNNKRLDVNRILIGEISRKSFKWFKTHTATRRVRKSLHFSGNHWGQFSTLRKHPRNYPTSRGPSIVLDI